MVSSIDFIPFLIFGSFSVFHVFFFNFISEEKLNSTPLKNDSLRHQLEEIVKQMLLVWAKEGIALSVVSGEKNGMQIVIAQFAFNENLAPRILCHFRRNIFCF